MSADICNTPTFHMLKKEGCTGCMACYNSCPASAISIKNDSAGYQYPGWQSENCIHCNLCVISCPALKPTDHCPPYQYYGATALNQEIVLKSSSGGMFSLLTDAFLSFSSSSGCCYIAGAVYSEDFKHVQTICTNSSQLIKKMRTAKYVQSEKRLIYREIKQHLEKGESVLFSGAPCETAGLRCFLQKNYHNLTCVDFICKGCAPPSVLCQYTDKMEELHRSAITDLNMRYKWEGMDRFIPQYLRIVFHNKKIFLKEFYNTEAGIAFKILQRPSCISCRYREKKHESDLTIGDYHGSPGALKCYSPYGTSVIIINSEKGKKLFEMISDHQIAYEKISFEDVYGRNRNTPHPQREKFEQLYIRHGLFTAVKKTTTIKDKLKMKLPVKLVRFLTASWRKLKDGGK